MKQIIPQQTGSACISIGNILEPDFATYDGHDAKWWHDKFEERDNWWESMHKETRLKGEAAARERDEWKLKYEKLFMRVSLDAQNKELNTDWVPCP